MEQPILAALRDRPMTAYQIAVVAMCVLINTIDGFDILAISFAAPAIAREWGLNPERTGFMFSSGLAGIGLGALLFAFVADAVGRRPVILFGSLLIAVGMAASAFVDSVGMMALCRLVSGLGIGSMVATAGTLAIENSSRRWRTLSVALVVLGFPLGGTLGGPVAVWLLEHHGWRSIFLFGAVACRCCCSRCCCGVCRSRSSSSPTGSRAARSPGSTAMRGGWGWRR